MTRVPDDDAEFGRMLAEGLGRAVAAPVDERGLLAGARSGAVRIRRRRQAAVGVAAALVVALPAGVVATDLLRPAPVTTAGNAADAASEREVAAAGSAADQAAGQAGGAGDQPVLASPGAAAEAGSPSLVMAPPDGALPVAGSSDGVTSAGAGTATGPVPGSEVAPATPSRSDDGRSKAAGVLRTAGGAVVVPDGVLPVPADLPGAGLEQTSDTANGVAAGPMSAADTCGTALTGRPSDVGSRAVVLERSPGTWLLGGTARVFAGSDAQRYTAAVRRIGCARPVGVPGADEAFVGQSPVDARGRTRWYGVVRVGAVLTEVRLLVPDGAAAGRADVVRLLATSAQRLTASGLPAAVAADPALR